MSYSAPPSPPQHPTTRPLATGTAETALAPATGEVTASEPDEITGFLRHLNTPRVAFGQDFTLRQVVFVLFFVFCLTSWASPPLALTLGLVLAQTIGNPFGPQTKQATAKLLQFSVIGLGFGMNAHAAVQAGREGILFTVVSIFGTLTLGYFVGKWLGLGRHVVHLIFVRHRHLWRQCHCGRGAGAAGQG